LQKKNIYFKEIKLNYILFKIFSIASCNFFPLFWQQVNSAKKKKSFLNLSIYQANFLFFYMFWRADQQGCAALIKINDNLKVHSLVNTQRVIKLPCRLLLQRVIKHRWATKSSCIFFELLLDVSDSKHDLNRLIVVDNAQQWLFDSVSVAHNTMTPFIFHQMHNNSVDAFWNRCEWLV